jgi:hypothetical protein
MSFILYISSGFVLGVFTPLIMLGSVGTEFSFGSFSFLGIYGVLGSACSITAWNHVRKHVPYNKPIRGVMYKKN